MSGISNKEERIREIWTDPDIMRFFNRKNDEAMLQWKKNIVTKSKFLVSHSLCPYYRYLEERCKDLQRLGRIRKSFLSWSCCDDKSH